MLVEKDDDSFVAGSSNGPLTNGREGTPEESVGRLAPAPRRPMVFSQTTIHLLDRAIPGDATLDEKIKKILDSVRLSSRILLSSTTVWRGNFRTRL